MHVRVRVHVHTYHSWSLWKYVYLWCRYINMQVYKHMPLSMGTEYYCSIVPGITGFLETESIWPLMNISIWLFKPVPFPFTILPSSYWWHHHLTDDIIIYLTLDYQHQWVHTKRYFITICGALLIPVSLSNSVCYVHVFTPHVHICTW